MRQKRVFLALSVSGILLAAPLLFSFLRTGAAANTDSLLGYWKFEEAGAADAKVDASGDGHNGAPSGTVLPQPSTNTPPTVYGNGRSLTFGNTNNALNISSTDEIDDLAQLTASAWVYPTTYAGESTQGRIIDKTNSVNGWSLYVDNGALHFYANFSTSPLHKVTTTTLPLNTWANVAVSWDGTSSSSGVKIYIDGVEQTSFSTDTSGTGSRVSDDSYNLIIGNNSALNRSFGGQIDEVRLYGRILSDSELSDIGGGDHPLTAWTGLVSEDYETAGNWDTGAIPDPYSRVQVVATANQPTASTDISLSGLIIDSGARLNLLGHNLTMNDGGTFSNEGTLQLRNSQTISGLNVDTDSGTVLLTPVGDTTGLKAGNNYHNLVLNDSTFAYWPLDESAGSVATDESGFVRHADYQGEPTPATDVAPTNFANDRSLQFDGDDYLSFDDQTMPPNATWCAWVNMASGDGVVLGADTPGQYALAIYGGTEVRAYDATGGYQASWNVASLYGNWHHICITQTDGGTTFNLSLYIDGVSQGGFEALLDGAGLINTIGTDTVDYFDGLIDDVRIFSRVLTGMEINRLVSGNQPGTTLYRTTLGAAANIDGSLVVNSGIFDVSSNNYGLNIAGDIDNNGGVFQGRSSTITLDGTDQRIKSTGTYFNLIKQVTSAATLQFGRGSTTTISNQLTLTGVENELLSLRSSTPGEEWFIDAAGSETIGYLDVQDSHNINGEPVDITDTNTVDSGNNTNWTVNVAPDAPTSLGGSSYVDGSYVGDSTPTLSFTLHDDNLADELRYQVQIDDTSDFSSPEVDYISALGNQGVRSFTVGQADDDDTYLSGSDGMSLPTADYYWRVKTIDGYSTPHESGYTVAHGGAVAFQLDVTPPTDPGTPSTASSQTEKLPTWTWDASTDEGVGIGSPTYTLQWSKDETFDTGVSSIMTDNTSFTHGSNLSDGYWYFRVQANDSLGNQSQWVVSTAHLIDTTGPTTPVAPFTSTPTNFNQPTWSWSAPTDGGVGLAAVPYTVQWSQVSNFSSGVTTDTSATNSYPHASTLPDGTWYFRVRAVDAIGNESAWSASGSVLIDTSPPSLPGAPHTDTPTNDNTPTWAWDPSIDSGVGLTASPYFVQWSSTSNFSSVGGSTSSPTNGYTHGGSLADGTWYIRVNTRDLLSNQSAYSGTGQVTIDTVAPDVPEAPSTTTPTNDQTPTWTWPVPDDTGVGLSDVPYEVEWSTDTDFNTVTGSDTIEANSFTHETDLAEGTWYFRVRATDSADNTSEFSANGQVEIDATPPTVPGDPETLDPVNDDTPTWSWSASTDAGVGLETPPYEVEWSTDATFQSEVVSDTADAEAFTHSDELPDGTWYFRVRAVDDVGNRSGWSNAGSKVVDINPPTVPGTPSTDSPTADNTPEWTWVESTDAGVGLDETPYVIEWSQDEDFLAGVVSDTITPNSFTHTDPLADGTWYFRVRAVDDVGNASAYSPTGSVFVDATAPTDPGTPTTDTPTIDSTPTWVWTASSDGTGTGLADESYQVEWSTDSDFSDAVESGTSGTNSFTHTDPLADGTWYFRVRAVDEVSNQSAWSATGSVEVDDTPPSVPGEPSTVTPTNNDTPTWSWNASTDNGVGLRDPAYDIAWSQDSNFESGVSTVQTDADQFTHSASLPDGTWYFRVRAVDTLGNQSAWSESGEVLVSTAGPTIPGTPATDDPTTDTTPTWTWAESTSDAELDVPPYFIEWSTDNDFLVNVFSDTADTNSFTHTDPLADGTWYFRVRAEDKTGLFSPYSAAGSVLVDTTAPSVPGTLTTPTPTNEPAPSWTWNASTDEGVGLAAEPYLVEWTQDNTFGLEVVSVSAETAAFTHTDPLADGTWYFRVRSYDVLGNESAWSDVASVYIDQTAPSVPGTPDTATPTNDQTPTWTWDGSTDDGVGLKDPAYETQWSQDNTFASGIHSATMNSTNFTHTDPLADGTWYFRVRAVDEVSNQSAWSATGEVEVDASVPTTPGTPTTGVSSTNDQTPAWTWSSSSDSGTGLGSPSYEVQWSQDNTFASGVSNDTAAVAGFTHSSDLSEGTWYFRVRAVDAVGNRSGWSGVGLVFVDTDTPTAPGTPQSSPSPTNDRTPAWSWAPSTDEGFGFGDEPYEIQWSQDSNFADGVTDATAIEESFTHSADLSDGTWHFRVRAVDDAGNQSDWSAHGSVVVDASAPTTPGNLHTDTPTKDSTPTWTWDASTDEGVGLADPTYEFEWSDDEDFVDNLTTQTTNDPTFTHSDELDFGVWYFRVRAKDQLGNQTAWVSSSVYIDSDPPVISAVKVVAGSGGAVITWKTDEVASTRIEYGTGNFDSTTTEADTSPRVTSHSVTLTGLPSCSIYRFRVVSIDQLDNEAVGDMTEFMTTACSGNAAVTGRSRKIIGVDGGNLGLSSGSSALKLDVPGGALSGDLDFQLKQLSPAPALSGIGQPTGRRLVGSHTYDLKAVDGNTIISSFNGSLAVTIGYTAAEVAGFTESSLLIFRHDGTAWQQLEGCNVNTAARSVSCPTNNFSVFGLFGILKPKAPAPQLPEGEGTVEPDPLPETAAPDPTEEDDQNPEGQAEAVRDSRGLSAAVTRVFSTVVRRPVWWASLLLLIAAVTALIVMKKRRGRSKHVPYGIHRSDD